MDVRAKLSMKLETEKMKRLDFMTLPRLIGTTDGHEDRTAFCKIATPIE
jgi:hypothetical protein